MCLGLAALTNLECLEMGNITDGNHNPLRLRAWSTLCSFLPLLTSLRKLGLARCSMGDAGALQVAPVLAQLPLLAWVDVSKNHLSSVGLAVLASTLRTMPLLLCVNAEQRVYTGRQESRGMRAMLEHVATVHVGGNRYDYGRICCNDGVVAPAWWPGFPSYMEPAGSMYASEMTYYWSNEMLQRH
jgi:hypothetical protein